MAAPKISARTEPAVSVPGPSNVAFSMKLPQHADFKKALIKQYGEAIARSRKVGHRVSFRVDVDPAADAQTITLVEEQPNAAETPYPVEDVGERDAELRAALTAARQRGHQRVAEILAGEEMLTAKAFAQLLGVSRVTVNAKRQSGQVLGLDGAKRGFRFPAWQLDDDGRPFAALPVLFERLGNSAWAVYRFLVAPHDSLNGRTGLKALRRREDAAVLAASESVARGEFR